MSTKVFISDIHLTDTSTGNHNISLQTLQNFFGDIKKDVKDAGGMDKLELIILGDFIDVIRSTKWKDTIQPWGGLQEIKPIVKDIIDTVISKNQSIFDELKKYVNEEGIKISYVIGNHDRLINSDDYDDIREKIRKALGLKPTKEKFPWEYYSDGFPIYGVHGNDYDIYNITKDNALPIGDAIVTLLINRYPDEVNKELQDPQVYKALQEIDNLRPSTLAPYWIDHIKMSIQSERHDTLKDTWNRLADKFFEDTFVKNWFHANDHWYSLFDDADKLEIAFRHFTETSSEKVYEKYLEIKKDFIKETDQNAMEALKLVDKYKCDYILFGHTHESCIHLLDVDAKNGKEKYYINTGTWRNRIVPGGYKRKGIVFGHQESIDYAIFTIDDSVSEQKIKSFQLWEGTVSNMYRKDVNV